MLTLVMLGLLAVLARDAAPAAPPAPGGANRARPTPPTSQPAEAQASLRKLMAARVEVVDWENVTFEDALAELREASHINVAVRWRVLEERGVTRTVPVTLHLRDVTVAALVSELLRHVSPEPELRYMGAENILVISTAEDLNRTMYVKVYSVTDLIQYIPGLEDQRCSRCCGENRYAIPRSAGDDGPGSSGGGNPPKERPKRRGSGRVAGAGCTLPEHLSMLIDVIKATIEPEVWEENGGGATIAVFKGGALVVRAPLHVHEKLGGPLILDER